MTTLINNEHHLRMLEIIEEREGKGMAIAHESEKTMIELENHFDTHYRIFENDVEACYVIESALEQLSEHDFYDLVKRNAGETTDVYEMLILDGFITHICGVWVLSLEYPWEGSETNEFSI